VATRAEDGLSAARQAGGERAAGASAGTVDAPGATRQATADRRPRLVVVTGLPRSGTSMAMRMLGAGGVPLVDDGRRAPGPGNPHGWFEDERVRRLRAESAWLLDEVGRAVKIVLPLVSAIPDDLPCDLVWMRRPISEVLESQRRLLAEPAPGASPRSEPTVDDDAILARACERAEAACIRWLRERPTTRWLELECARVQADPGRASGLLAEFVGEPFDRAASAAAVDRSLYRVRSV